MATMGAYCKAYLAENLRAYSDWAENLDNLQPEKKETNGQEEEIPRTELKDDDILYLQENYVVTDGIFKDENIIFDKVTDEWKAFCTETLEFEIPVYEPIEIKDADDGGDSEESAAAAEEEDGDKEKSEE